MKITQIKSFMIGDDDRRYHIVKVETDEGIYGLGEVGIGFWGAAIEQALGHLSEIVVGEDPFSTERLWQHMFRGSFFPADKVYCSAISAIDIALWDIKGKAAGDAGLQAAWRTRTRQGGLLSPQRGRHHR